MPLAAGLITVNATGKSAAAVATDSLGAGATAGAMTELARHPVRGRLPSMRPMTARPAAPRATATVKARRVPLARAGWICCGAAVTVTGPADM